MVQAVTRAPQVNHTGTPLSWPPGSGEFYAGKRMSASLTAFAVVGFASKSMGRAPESTGTGWFSHERACPCNSTSVARRTSSGRLRSCRSSLNLSGSLAKSSSTDGRHRHPMRRCLRGRPVGSGASPPASSQVAGDVRQRLRRRHGPGFALLGDSQKNWKVVRSSLPRTIAWSRTTSVSSFSRT